MSARPQRRIARANVEPLLCELHAHTTWSDGRLSLRELIDLYGAHGFDVLCVTDHTLRRDDPWLRRNGRGPHGVDRGNFADYLDEVHAEAERASSLYGLLVVPGLELTYNDLDPARAAHAVAVGLREFVGVDGGPESAMGAAREAGAAIIAAHPFRPPGPSSPRNTQRFARDWRELADLVDRYELFNRTDLFPWVAEVGLRGVASGDFHRHEHLGGWKTLIPSAREEEAVVAHLRSALPVYLARLEPGALTRLAA